MRAKTLTIVSIMVAAMLFTVSLSWAKGGNADRQKKQIRRISGGVKSGEITRKESKRLGREQRRIGQIKRNARADGPIRCRTGRVDTFTWPNTMDRNGIPENRFTGTDTSELGLDITTILYIIGISQHITATTLRWDTQTLIIPSPGP
jgi:hypothetical protein